MSTTLKRGLFHIFAGLLTPITALFLPRVILLIALGVITCTFVAFELLRCGTPGINRYFVLFFKPVIRDAEQSRLTGASYMLIASFIAFLVFQRDIAVLALCFLAIGDAMATMVGKHLGRWRLLGKTVEGSLACFVSCAAVGLIFYYAGFNIRLLAILVGAAGAAVAEAVPIPVNDNLTIPLFAGLVMTLMQL